MKEKIKIIQMIHLVLTLGVALAYFSLAEIASINELFILPEINNSTIYIGAIPIVAYIFSNIIFKTLISRIDKKLKIEANLGAYQTASLIRWAILEGAAFLIIINNPDFILFGVVLIIYLALLRPTEIGVTKDLKNL